MEQLIVHEIHQILLNFMTPKKRRIFHGALLMHNKAFSLYCACVFGIIQ